MTEPPVQTICGFEPIRSVRHYDQEIQVAVRPQIASCCGTKQHHPHRVSLVYDPSNGLFNGLGCCSHRWFLNAGP